MLRKSAAFSALISWQTEVERIQYEKLADRRAGEPSPSTQARVEGRTRCSGSSRY